jgi:3-phosphoshikimate 1-carboxyvinyltransferase
LSALKTELEKTGVKVEIDDSTLELSGQADPQKITDTIFNTYNDHRMAMALSILSATGSTVNIENPEVVNKSYPGYWEELKKRDFSITYSNL